MADLFDYLIWRGDLPMDLVPPNPVDTLILSALSYLDYDGLVPGDFLHPVPLHVVEEAFAAMPDRDERVRVKRDADLLAACAATERFGHLKLAFYRSELLPQMQSQFAALTWLLPDGTAMITYRGTDMTITGWKEDFNMSFQSSVPAQEKALWYLEAFARVHMGPIRLTGHSKGGNLAVYAAARTVPENQERILSVHNHDGPGFHSHVLRDPGYRAILPKTRTFLPQSSVVGMLLEHEEPYTVVRSRQVSLLQHEPYTWEVLGGGFVELEEVDDSSRFLDRTIKEWLSGMDNTERNEIVDTVFDLLSLGDAKSVFDLIQPKNVRTYLKTLSADGKLRKILSDEFMSLMEAARKTQLALEDSPAAAEDLSKT